MPINFKYCFLVIILGLFKQTFACGDLQGLSYQLTGNIASLSWAVSDVNVSDFTHTYLFENGVFKPENAQDSIWSIAQGRSVLGINANKSGNYSSWVLDDFNLINKTKINKMIFFVYQKNQNTSTDAIKAVYVKIFKNSPLSGGILIWGNETTNRLKSSSLTRLYRDRSGKASENNPILKVEAELGTVLSPGNYWVEVSFESASELPVYAVTSDLAGENGLQRRLNNRFFATDNLTREQLGLCFSVEGESCDLAQGFNIYRDGSKLNAEFLKSFNYKDILSAAGTYTYGVSVVCKEGGESESKEITLVYDPADTLKSSPWYENFEPVTFEDMYEIYETGSNSWKLHTEGTRQYPSKALSGRKFAYFQNETNEENTTKLMSPAFNFSEFESVTLKFGRYHKKWGLAQDYLRVLYRTKPDADWTVLDSYMNDQSAWKEETISLSDYAYCQFAFEGTAKYGHGIALDTISITSSPGIPQNLTASVVNGKNKLVWSTPASNGGNMITGYMIYIYKEGSLETEITTVNPATGYNFSNLDDGKSYTFSLRAKNAIGTGKMSDMSNAIIANDPTGINDVISSANIRIYPNPATEEITIESIFPIEKVIIRNIVGKEVYNDFYTIKIQLSHLPVGIYILETESLGIKGKQKILKK